VLGKILYSQRSLRKALFLVGWLKILLQVPRITWLPSIILSPNKMAKKTVQKTFDWTKSRARKVAFRLSYLGENFHGFTGLPEDAAPTIEGCLFKALLTSKLIPSYQECDWSRAGRTDKGVSGYGQVVSLWIRTKCSDPIHTKDWESVKDLKAERMSEEEDQDLSLASSLDQENEFSYMEILNRLLPQEIRILAWTPVHSSFDSRFSCKWRKYKYFFPNKRLDLERMQLAASHYVGTHDCRFICKIDSSKVGGPNFFIREIFESKIERFLIVYFYRRVNDEFSVFVVRGKAFLWHQVRNMMALLFMVGKGYEEPQMIKYMLDPTQHPLDSGKPNYNMAPDEPLVLIECGYGPNLIWRLADSAPQCKNQSRVLSLVKDQRIEASLKTIKLETLEHEYTSLGASLHGTIQSFGEPPHISLGKRGRAHSASAVLAKKKHLPMSAILQ
jgi:tRNA pseudouridine38/39 synthase